MSPALFVFGRVISSPTSHSIAVRIVLFLLIVIFLSFLGKVSWSRRAPGPVRPGRGRPGSTKSHDQKPERD